jgi:hypothetical protein
MDDYPVNFVLSAAVLGIALGTGLSFWRPEDSSGKDTAIFW